MEIWTCVTDALRTDSQTVKDRATQLLIKYKSGALVAQLDSVGLTVHYEVMKLCTGSI